MIPGVVPTIDHVILWWLLMGSLTVGIGAVWWFSRWWFVRVNARLDESMRELGVTQSRVLALEQNMITSREFAVRMDNQRDRIEQLRGDLNNRMESETRIISNRLDKLIDRINVMYQSRSSGAQPKQLLSANESDE